MRKLVIGLAGLFAATATTSIALAAASAVAKTGDQLEEVVVTAEKVEGNLQKTAISIQTYDGKTLAKEGKKKIDDIMRGVVGVQAQDNQTGASFAMRGVDTGTAGPPNQNPGATVAILIDGVYQTRAETARAATLDVSQVEVMRGTQSTNLGASALAGAVNLVSNKPNFDRMEGNATLEAGNYNLRNLEAVFNAPLSSTQAVRFAGSINKRDGYLSSGAGDNDITNARVKYRWRPSDRFDMTLTVNSQHLGGNGVSAGVLTYEGQWQAYDPARNSNILLPVLDANGQPVPDPTTGAALLRIGTNAACGATGQPSCYDRVMGYPGLFGHVDSATTWRQRSNPWDDGYPADQWPNHPFRDSTITQYSAELTWNTSLGTVTVTPEVEKARFHSAEPPRGNSWMSEDRHDPTEQIEARIASPQSSRTKWLAGAYYYHHDQTGTFETINDPYSSGGPPVPCLPPQVNDPVTGLPIAGLPYSQVCNSWTNDAENSLKTLSAFGSLVYPVTNTLRATAGVRYSKDHRAVTSAPNAVVGTAYGPGGAYQYVSYDADYSATTYRLGAEYDLRPQSMLYLTYATGYQPGVVAVGGPPPGYAITPKNTTTQWTLGIKNRFLDNRLQLNAEIFELKFKDRPFNDPTSIQAGTASCLGPPGVAVVNIVDASNYCLATAGAFTMPNQKSQGLDLELSYLPTASDRLDLNLEVLDSTYGANPVSPVDYVVFINAASGPADGKAAAIAAYNALIGSYTGVTLQNAPKTSGNLTYEHRFTLPNGSTFAPRLNLFYKAKYWAQGGGPPPFGFSAATALNSNSVVLQDAYQFVNAFATWTSADGKLGLTGYVKNIANKAVQTNLSAEPGSSLMAISLDAPRTFGITLNASF